MLSNLGEPETESPAYYAILGSSAKVPASTLSLGLRWPPFRAGAHHAQGGGSPLNRLSCMHYKTGIERPGIACLTNPHVNRTSMVYTTALLGFRDHYRH